MEIFRDRLDAGYRLGRALHRFAGSHSVVLGLARGGVIVGYGVAKELGTPLHALVVRKLGAPSNPELAIGAVSETGERVLDIRVARATGASEQYLQHEIAVQVAEARRRQEEYRTGPGLESVRGRIAIVADDGIATGSSALVAVRSARSLGASQVVLAAPVASQQAEDLLRPDVDALVVLETPDPFVAVGMYYHNFEQTDDADVKRYLEMANTPTTRVP
ncbi:MAG TPA: phosphoribosyltransferase family protein [Chloroflexota bacterium]|nr:phosphoribosyltransferase family protein [Chloroflexota bacterium]